MSTKRAVLIAATAVALLAGSAGAVAIAQSETTFLVTRGASMQPAYSAGDLVLLRPSETYEVGDVAGYRNQALDRVVLHRIVALDGDAFTFQGDANSFRDPEPVDRDDVVGEVSLRLPRVGAVLLWLVSPVNVLLLTAVAALAAGVRRRRPAHVELGSDRVVAIDDLALPSELPVTDVADVADLLRLAERHDRPVLHDQRRGLLYVLEGSVLFRCRLDGAPTLTLVPPQPRKSRRQSVRGPGWDYDDTGT